MLWKKYGEDLVLATGRFRQIEVRNLLPCHLLKKEMIGYVNVKLYWIVYREQGKLFRSFFAKNSLWFKALASESEFTIVRELPQIYLV